jgi:transcriptional regulator with PAS, ATPase and Fis domain
MRALFERLEAIADSSASVLILGETGSGKELVAQRLHALSPRAAGPLVPVSCTAFPDSLIEAELFGYERGAFTGATQRRKGRFVAASGGTLFLDEVAEISLPVQAKLLRVLQEPLITPLGTDRPVEVDVRIIAATHQDLKLMVSEGTFREDLYYRLNVLDLVVPPLRQRKSDLAALVSTFVLRYSRDGLEPVISSAAWAALKAHDYPGNVRELAHAIEHACVLSRGKEIQLHHLPGEMTAGMAAVQQDFVAQETLSSAMASYERQYLTTVLRRHGGRRSKAAEALGISRKNLWEKLRNHQLGDKDFIQ